MSQQPESQSTPAVLVTGATGYNGGRLVPVLEAAGVRLRCLALEQTGQPGWFEHSRLWYALLPVHALIFGGLLRAIARRALSRS